MHLPLGGKMQKPYANIDGGKAGFSFNKVFQHHIWNKLDVYAWCSHSLTWNSKVSSNSGSSWFWAAVRVLCSVQSAGTPCSSSTTYGSMTSPLAPEPCGLGRLWALMTFTLSVCGGTPGTQPCDWALKYETSSRMTAGRRTYPHPPFCINRPRVRSSMAPGVCWLSATSCTPPFQ